MSTDKVLHVILRSPTGCIVQELTMRLDKIDIAARDRHPEYWGRMLEKAYDTVVQNYLEITCSKVLFNTLDGHFGHARELLLACGYTIMSDVEVK